MHLAPVVIVIPTRNDAATLPACLRSVAAHASSHPDWRLIVVVDGSTDATPAILSEFAPLFPADRLTLLRQKNLGVARALNAALAHPAAAGRDLLRLHSDVVVETPGFLEKLSAAAHASADRGIVGARILLPDGRIQSEGRAFVTGLGLHPQHRDRRAFSPAPAAGSATPVEVDGVAGACAYYRRDLLDAIGGFDPGYGAAWMEDDDACVAARVAGRRVHVLPAVSAVHYTRALQPGFISYVHGTGPQITQLCYSLKDVAQRLQADYWERKWGWHPYFPDLGEIRRLYGHTPLCWQIGERLASRETDPHPTVDCCLVTWNTLPLLKRCLESLAATRYPADRLAVYVADNGSTDGTLDYLDALAATYPFPIHVTKLPVNTGCPIGLNFAVQAGRGRLVARLDDDIVLPPDWLQPLVDALRARPFAGCVGPKIVNDNPARTVQCGPYRHFPSLYGHDDEADAGQADYLSRCTHVRGCCNLYRRDVFARAGLFDLRYSPTQFDDPDHHVALLQAGYEILYEGRVAVVHKLNNGLARSAAGIANQQGNSGKFFGKWAANVFEVLERSLDLSREGRYLPDDGDTSALLDAAPDPASYPRRDVAPAADKLGLVERVYAELAPGVLPPAVADIRDRLLALVDIKHRTGAPGHAPDILLTALGLCPEHPALYVAFAKTNLALGLPDAAGQIARRGLHLAPGDAELLAFAGQSADAAPRVDSANASMLHRADAIGEAAVSITGAASSASVDAASGPRLRVLMVNTFEPRLSGGDMHQVKKTRQYLQSLGVHVDVACTPRPDPRGYDLVHVWNSWFPAQTLPQLKAIRALRPDIPVVLSPIYWNMREKAWADRAVPAIFAEARSPQHLHEQLQLLAADRFVHRGSNRASAPEPNFNGYELYQRQLFGLVDHLLPQSHAEVANLRATLGVELPHTLVPNGAEHAVFDRATPEDFVRRYGLRDFVLIVGLVEPRKNQLMLLHALKETGLPVVVIGRHYDLGYYRLCREHAPKNALFIDHLPHEQLASAFKAARVHCLPSWMECAAFANVEAALCGCALAVSDRTSEKEYFGDNAYACDPGNLVSIRNAVLAAWRNHAADASKREALREQFRTRYTWEAAARATFAGYEAALAARRGASASAHA